PLRLAVARHRVPRPTSPRCTAVTARTSRPQGSCRPNSHPSNRGRPRDVVSDRSVRIVGAWFFERRPHRPLPQSLPVGGIPARCPAEPPAFLLGGGVSGKQSRPACARCVARPSAPRAPTGRQDRLAAARSFVATIAQYPCCLFRERKSTNVQSLR